MVVNASNREKIVSWLEKHSSGFDVKLTDLTESWAMIAVQGPKSLTYAQMFIDVDLQEMKYYYCSHAHWKEIPIVVSRTGYTGEDGIEIMIASDHAENVWSHLKSAGAFACGLGSERHFAPGSRHAFIRP